MRENCTFVYSVTYTDPEGAREVAACASALVAEEESFQARSRDAADARVQEY